MSLIPDDVIDLLTRPLIGSLATVRADGDPTVTPMWYGWDGELLRFSHTSKREKVRNMASNPHVSMSVFDPDQPNRYLQIRGNVERIEPDPTGSYHVELAVHYGEQDPVAPADAADRVIITVRPFAFTRRAGQPPASAS